MNNKLLKNMRLFVSLVLIAPGVAMAAGQEGQALKERNLPVKVQARVTEHVDARTLVIKFKDDQGVSIADNEFVSTDAAASNQRDHHSVRTLLRTVGAKRLETVFKRPLADLAAERADGESRSREKLADLSQFFFVRLSDKTAIAEIEALVDELNALESVEIAYLQNKAALPRADISPPTPNFESAQVYLDAAPGGIDARYAWTRTGGKGANMRVADVEFGWRTSHEDLKNPAYEVNNLTFDQAHGTAVLGVLIGDANNFGVTGIAHQANFHIVGARDNWGVENVANAVNTAAQSLLVGDVLNLELQTWRSVTGATPDCNKTNYVPMEYDVAVFNAVKQATTNGKVVVAAAGNGNMNLDCPGFNGIFDRAVQDSGAIMVGAGMPPNALHPRSRMSFSNYGSRLDVQGQGFNVVTSGGVDLDLFYGNNELDQAYTQWFSGTSSAAAIIAGAATSLQGFYKSRFSSTLTSSQMRSLMQGLSTPHVQSPDYPGYIGPQPDLKKIIEHLSSAKGDFNGDGKADILWYNAVTGMLYEQQMNGFSLGTAAAIFTEPNLNWTVAAIGDLNGDNKADVIWYHLPSRTVYGVIMNGTTIQSQGVITVESNPQWKLVAAGDFNGDGKTDLLWRNNTTGEVFVRFLDGLTPGGGGVVYTEPNANWTIVKAADLNADGRDDILWRNTVTGQVFQLLLDGTTVLGGSVIYTEPDTNWQIAGVGDLDGDRKADVVWRNIATGDVYALLRPNGVYTTVPVYSEPNSNWKIVAVADCDGDARADILWRNSVTGQVFMQKMSGSTVTNSAFVYTEPDQNWKILAP